MNTPVLLIIFNKLEPARLVFERIAAVQPKKLYIASDGARAGVDGEALQVDAVRKYVMESVTWPCEVKTRFRDSNFGCSRGPSDAISWMFEHEESGIILEDDTVPELSFFPYCEELLLRYQFDQRIGMISGNNHLSEYEFSESYLFSKFKWTWGWATWRRAWANQDLKLECMKSPAAASIIENMGYTPKSQRLWERNLSSIEAGRVAAWDYQWFLSLSAQNQLSIVPRRNLVANVGFGVEGSTHCKGSAPLRFTETGGVAFPLLHPGYVVPDFKYERVCEELLVRRPGGFKRYIPQFLKRFVKKMIAKWRD
jgi:hypothetical protein